jgi:hypothetical protein
MNEPVLSGGVVEEEEGEFEERDFSPSGLERLLRESLTALRPPARHELAIRVLDMLVGHAPRQILCNGIGLCRDGTSKQTQLRIFCFVLFCFWFLF